MSKTLLLNPPEISYPLGRVILLHFKLYGIIGASPPRLTVIKPKGCSMKLKSGILIAALTLVASTLKGYSEDFVCQDAYATKLE